jgi:hypothetical protein
MPNPTVELRRDLLKHGVCEFCHTLMDAECEPGCPRAIALALCDDYDALRSFVLDIADGLYEGTPAFCRDVACTLLAPAGGGQKEE